MINNTVVKRASSCGREQTVSKAVYSGSCQKGKHPGGKIVNCSKICLLLSGSNQEYKHFTPPV